MLRELDGLRNSVKIQDILHRFREPKEDTNTSIRHKLVRATRTSRKGVDTTTKNPKKAEIGLTTGTDLKRGSLLITMDSNIVQAKPMMEGIRPELGRQIGATKHGTQCITNSLMRTFTGAILTGSSGGSGFNKVARMLKQADNLLTMSQVTTLIQANVLIGNVSRKTMKDKPSIKKIKGGSFVAETFAIQGTGASGPRAGSSVHRS
jgi:hypothetical protein